MEVAQKFKTRYYSLLSSLILTEPFQAFKMARLGKRRRHLISISTIGGKAPKLRCQRSNTVADQVPMEENTFPSDLELEAREYQASSECEEAPLANSLESTAAESNASPEFIDKESLKSPEDGEFEEAWLYGSEEDTDDEWELEDGDSDVLSGSDEVLYLLYVDSFRY
jgi:hypothetical protein